MSVSKKEVPVENKLNLTITEAAAYSNIGINRIERLLKTPGCPFLLEVGTKRLVKRRQFEDYLSKRMNV